MRTLGSVSAFITALSLTISFSARMYAVSAYTSSSVSVRGCCHGVARRVKSKSVVARTKRRYLASWKITPSVRRWPDRRRLTP